MKANGQHKHSLLLVEDHDDTREMLALFLESKGYLVHEASDGADAMRKIVDLPDLCLMITDWRMPNMGGEQLVCALRASERYANIPVAVTSAVADRAERALSSEREVWFLSKPVQFQRLLQVVEGACRK